MNALYNTADFHGVIKMFNEMKNFSSETILYFGALALDQQALLEKDVSERKKMQREAIKTIRILLKKFPKSTKGYRTLGLIYQHQNKLVRALSLYKESSRMDPKDFSIFLAIGNGYRALKKYTMAEKWYKKALVHATLKHLAYINLHGLFVEKGDTEQAEEYRKKALKILGNKKDQFSRNQVKRLTGNC